MKPLVDVQNREDFRNVPLQKVGVKNIRYPLTVLDRVNKTQTTTGTVNLYVNLPHNFKGTHMSRFIEVFHEHSSNLRMEHFMHMLRGIRTTLDAQRSFGEIRFPFFREKIAPVSKQPSLLEYVCSYKGECSEGDEEFYVGVRVPVLTLCPCSREISSRGAHNQRSFVEVQVQMTQFFWIEQIIDIVESSASAGLYTLLKREDEKWITEHSYDNPVFVEDLVREVTVKLEATGIFSWFSVEAENMESIHNHEAYAYVERGKKLG